MPTWLGFAEGWSHYLLPAGSSLVFSPPATWRPRRQQTFIFHFVIKSVHGIGVRKKGREITFQQEAAAPSHLHHRTTVRQSLGSSGSVLHTAGWGRWPVLLEVGHQWEERNNFPLISLIIHHLTNRSKSLQPNIVSQYLKSLNHLRVKAGNSIF